MCSPSDRQVGSLLHISICPSTASIPKDNHQTKRSGNQIAAPLVSETATGPQRHSTPGRAVQTEEEMLYWALFFLICALIAGFWGLGGIGFGAAGIEKILFFFFLVVFVVMLLAGLRGRRSPPI